MYIQVMKPQAPPLLPIFRSDLQARLLAELYLHPERALSLADLSRKTGSPMSTIHREVGRLDEADMVISDRVGNVRLVRANRDLPYFEELSGMLLKSFGPQAVLAEALADIKGIETAYIFGSWAHRYHGEPGSAPGDIDVLVIGNPVPDMIYEACRQAESMLGSAVNPTILSEAEWKTGTGGFIETVREGPLVPIIGEEK